MKTTLLSFAFISLLLCGCNNSRRYELTTAAAKDGFLYPEVIDTYTGKVWSYNKRNNNPDSNWEYLGNPAAAK